MLFYLLHINRLLFILKSSIKFSINQSIAHVLNWLYHYLSLCSVQVSFTLKHLIKFPGTLTQIHVKSEKMQQKQQMITSLNDLENGASLNRKMRDGLLHAIKSNLRTIGNWFCNS